MIRFPSDHPEKMSWNCLIKQTFHSSTDEHYGRGRFMPVQWPRNIPSRPHQSHVSLGNHVTHECRLPGNKWSTLWLISLWFLPLLHIISHMMKCRSDWWVRWSLLIVRQSISQHFIVRQSLASNSFTAYCVHAWGTWFVSYKEHL